jgi:hypothetical protein
MHCPILGSSNRLCSLPLVAPMAPASTVITAASCPRLVPPIRRCQRRSAKAPTPRRQSRPDSVPKPVGDPGKPGSGGYSIEKAMDWSNEDYESARVCHQVPSFKSPAEKHAQIYIKYLCERHLKLNVSYRSQNSDAVKTVVSRASLSMAVLRWLADSFRPLIAFLF